MRRPRAGWLPKFVNAKIQNVGKIFVILLTEFRPYVRIDARKLVFAPLGFRLTVVLLLQQLSGRFHLLLPKVVNHIGS